MQETNRLETQKVSSLLFSLSMPAICAQIVTLVYNMADRIYIGRMENGALAMAGIGICAPLISIVTAFTGLFGRGGAFTSSAASSSASTPPASRPTTPWARANTPSSSRSTARSFC